MSDDSNTRRRFLQATGAAATLAIAGCSGGGGGDTTTEDGGDETTESGGGETTEGGSMTTTGGGSMEVPQEVSDYLSDTSNFDGTVEDMTGSGNVEVAVGAEGNDGNYAYSPAAVRIDAGTDINWAWTGEGQAHNVVAESGAFDSGDPVDQSGNNFQHTFEETGVYRYYCTPHKALGMKGAVIVV